MASTDEKIPLADCITSLHEQIREAARREFERRLAAAGDDTRTPSFLLDSIELELETVCERSGKADGKVHYWVFSAGASAEVKGANTQRLKLLLKPEEDVLLGSRSKKKRKGKRK